MKKILVAVDLQKDFVDGALGTKEAVAIRENAAEKIRNFNGEIFVTFDTHGENYLSTAEGKKLPVPHCIKGTPGWELDGMIKSALEGKKYTVTSSQNEGYSLVVKAEKEGETTKTFKASGTKLVIKKLKKGKKYQVRIRAVKHNGLVSKYSKTKTGKKIK